MHTGRALEPHGQIVGVIGTHIAPEAFGSSGFNPLVLTAPSPRRYKDEGCLRWDKAKWISFSFLIVGVSFPFYVSIRADLPPRWTSGNKFISGRDFDDAVPSAELSRLLRWEFDMLNSFSGGVCEP